MVHGSLANPFGSTYLYAYNGMVVEVMKDSGHVATVTLFDTGARFGPKRAVPEVARVAGATSVATGSTSR